MDVIDQSKRAKFNSFLKYVSGHFIPVLALVYISPLYTTLPFS